MPSNAARDWKAMVHCHMIVTGLVQITDKIVVRYPLTRFILVRYALILVLL